MSTSRKCPTCRQKLPAEVLDFFKRGATHDQACACDACSGNVDRAIAALERMRALAAGEALPPETSVSRIAAKRAETIRLAEEMDRARATFRSTFPPDYKPGDLTRGFRDLLRGTK